MAYNTSMKTSDVHTRNTEVQDKLDEAKSAQLAADLQKLASAVDTEDDGHKDPNNGPNSTKKENKTEADQQTIIEDLKKLIEQEFDQLRNGIERYKWMQRDIEAHIRNMLHIVHAEHSRDSQVERMVAQVAVDIAATTIGEDMQGSISLKGYSEQFLVEVDQLGEVYRAREADIVDALEQSKTDQLSGKRDAFIDELVRKPLEHTKSAMYSTDAELIRLLQEQKRTIRENLNAFQQLQYFQTDDVWQNPAYRLLQEYCDKVIQVINTQLNNLYSQTESDEKQIDGLARESLLVIQKVQS